MQREGFGSRLGFILVSAGCAIGIGNVWRFPYVAGENGGGIFVFFYLLFLVIMGLPVLTMELSVGRASKQSAYLAYKTLEKPGTKWHLHGWICLFGSFVLMVYYTTVAGWMLAYFFKFITGTFARGMETDDIGAVFNQLQSSPMEMSIWMAITVIAGFLVCAKGLENGIEKISTYMMSILLVLIIILAVHSLMLPRASEGLSFYLVPNIDKVREIGLNKVITAAMNQAFFTLSIGIASMEIFGSYMSRDHTLPSEAGTICILDTFVAIMAGLIIFPACFAFGVAPDQGPALIFVTLPNVFVNMAGGRIWGSMFFLFMTFASFSTVIAVFENLIAYLTDTFGISRKKSVCINLVSVLLGSMPCVLGFNVWKNVLFMGDKNILDMEDYIVSNLLLPTGSLVFLLFCVTKAGWGFDDYLNECNTGKGIKFSSRLKPYFQFVLPVLIIFIFISGLR